MPGDNGVINREKNFTVMNEGEVKRIYQWTVGICNTVCMVILWRDWLCSWAISGFPDPCGQWITQIEVKVWAWLMSTQLRGIPSHLLSNVFWFFGACDSRIRWVFCYLICLSVKSRRQLGTPMHRYRHCTEIRSWESLQSVAVLPPLWAYEKIFLLLP